MRREATILRDHVRLAARLVTPEGAWPFPCVLFVHGLGSDRDSPRNVVVAERLVDRGIATLLFDLSGHGQSDPDPTGRPGAPEDVAAAFRWLAAQPEVDARRLGIAGSSLGGVLAVEAAAARSVTPQAMVLRAPPVAAGELNPVNAPTLVIVGSLDPLLWSVRATAERNPAITFEVARGAGHLFEEPGALDRAAELTVDWFVLHLGVAEPQPAV